MSPQQTVHRINCGTLCPRGAPLVLGVHRVPCRCLLVETERDGLVLVDTGIGQHDIDTPRQRLGWSIVWSMRPALAAAETAREQIRRLGHDPDQVRHIVITHLDWDHAGGLSDFPWATVHLIEAELEAARHPASPGERRRYRAAQWNDPPVRWRPYPTQDAEGWRGLKARRLEGLPPEILLVSLPGHTRGHAGVAVEGSGGWWLHAGDAFTLRQELAPEKHSFRVRLYHRMVHEETTTRRASLRALRQLEGVTLVASHEP